MDKGLLGEYIAKKLWPELVMTERGGELDKAGIDAYLDGEPVQIKYDEKIAPKGNIYHEVYEKSAKCPEQEWRVSPNNCQQYIFCSGNTAWRIRVNELARIERGLKLVAISKTSMGFIIPIKWITDYEKRELPKQPF